MSDDLVKRLRVMADRMPVANSQMCSDAADRIDALAAKLADLATPLDDPRVKALVDLINRAQDIIDPCYPAKHAVWQNDARAALSALKENK